MSPPEFHSDPPSKLQADSGFNSGLHLLDQVQAADVVGGIKAKLTRRSRCCSQLPPALVEPNGVDRQCGRVRRLTDLDCVLEPV